MRLVAMSGDTVVGYGLTVRALPPFAVPRCCRPFAVGAEVAEYAFATC